MSELLDIVNNRDEVIGREERHVVHSSGLLHREVHIWIYNDRGEILFQHRAKDKDTWPDKFDASVGGHVDLGQSYIESAIRELEEETGIIADKSDLTEIKKIYINIADNSTNTINNAFNTNYKYRYNGEELRVESGKAYGFEWWSLDKLKNLLEEDKGRFIPLIIDDEHIEMFGRFNNM